MKRLYLAMCCGFFLLILSIHASDSPEIHVSSCADKTTPASAIMDGNWTTRWGSDFSDPQWVMIDLGEPTDLVGVIIDWEAAYAYRYMLQLSDDGTTWKTTFQTETGDGRRDHIDFPRQRARYIRLFCQNRATAFGYSIYEIDLKTPKSPWGQGQSPHFFADPFYAINSNTYQRALFIPTSWSNETPYIQLAKITPPYTLTVNGKVVREINHNHLIGIPLSEHLHYGTTNTFTITTPCSGDDAPPTLKSILVAGSTYLYHSSINNTRKQHPGLYYPLVARLSPEGYYPYWLTGHQGYWTIIGVENDTRESLFCQDGTIEPYKSFSITPFVYANDTFITREEVALSQTLLDDYLPMPQVVWSHTNITLSIQTFAWGPPSRSVSYASYTISNAAAHSLTGRLFLALRPYEVNPPWQWGGLNRIDKLEQKDHLISANEFHIHTLTPPDAFGVANPTQGDIVNLLAVDVIPHKTSLHHPAGQASGALAYDFDLPPGATSTSIIAIPLHPKTTVNESYSNSFALCKNYWKRRLHAPIINASRKVINTIKSNLAYILINRDGPAIQPGSRAYEASWIRDAAGTTKALLRCGYTNEVRDFITWYGTQLYPDGRVPAIVIHNRQEINPVKEYDSQGEFIATIWNYYTHTQDLRLLKQQWKNVLKTLKFLVKIRESEEREEYLQQADQKRYYGILPKCVSHEGYYPEPGNHSYWDDFWALKGWSDASQIATVLGHTKKVPWMKREEEKLRTALYQSISNTMEHYHIDYLPGCAELGDFDASSSAGAITCCDELPYLPTTIVSNTFNRYWRQLSKRFDPDWTGSFSPYELRIIPAMLQLGWTNRAQQAFDYLLTQQQPAGWNQWPEALYIPSDTPGYIGDMPHTWIGGEFINTALDLFP